MPRLWREGGRAQVPETRWEQHFLRQLRARRERQAPQRHHPEARLSSRRSLAPDSCCEGTTGRDHRYPWMCPLRLHGAIFPAFSVFNMSLFWALREPRDGDTSRRDLSRHMPLKGVGDTPGRRASPQSRASPQHPLQPQFTRSSPPQPTCRHVSLTFVCEPQALECPGPALRPATWL